MTLRKHALQPYLADPDFTLYVGDALDVLRRLPEASVHCAITSPPYWGLRDYSIEPTDWPAIVYGLPGGDVEVPPATCALGLEQTPEAFVGHVVLSRLTNPGTQQKAQAASLRKLGERHRGKSSGLKNKDMVGIPWLLAFALREDGWWLRAENIWEKANPMPESTTDRPAKAHEQVFLLTKSERCFYDYVAVRENTSGTANSRGNGLNPKALQHADASSGIKQNAHAAAAFAGLTARRNLRSVWKVASRPFTGAHFAVFPPDLIEPCILAGTAAGGCCAECGSPALPVNEKQTLARHELPHDHPEYRPTRYVGKHQDTNGGGQRYLDVVTVDWKPTCSCSADVAPCVAIDPFMGSGTTALVARKLGRHAIGIEKSPKYAALAAERLAQQSLLAEVAAS